MSQNLVSMTLSPEEIAALNVAFAGVETILGPKFARLSVDERRSLAKMGDKSEAFVRQTMIVLAQNRQIIPPEMDFAEAERDLHNLDLLRPCFAHLRQLTQFSDDTEMALGSDLLAAALDGYALARVFGKDAAHDTLKDLASVRFSRKRKPSPAPDA